MIRWNEVTWYSRLGAVILFLVVVPTLCFYIGTQYQLTISSSTDFNLEVDGMPLQEVIPEQSSKEITGLEPKEKGVKDSVSPDGKYVAMLNSTEEYTGTYLANVEGKPLTKEYPGNVYAWSPDSTRALVFVSDNLSPDNKRHIFFLGIDDKYYDTGLPDGTYSAIMAPSGGWIYASSTQRGTDYADVVYRDANGKDITLVKGNRNIFTRFKWLPAGNQLSFQKADHVGNNPESWVVNLDGTGLARLSNV